MPSLLVIDDDAIIRHRLQQDLKKIANSIFVAETAAEGLAAVREHKPDAVILDVMLPDMSGLETFRKIREFNAQLPVIFVTTNGESETAIEAMTLGAYDYLLKPFSSNEIHALVSQAINSYRLMETPVELADRNVSRQGRSDVLIGRCSAMQSVYKAIGRVAPQNVTVLIQGESGTGKELVARAIYQHSDRSKGPFLAINCAAIPETLLESELFGHEQGAFTGAEQKRIGKFEQCSGGTLFLDEIADMSPTTQAKVLRLLQQQTFQRVGGDETISTDVRIIAATNAELGNAVADGQFRGDLYYRLNVFAIRLPPLRERAEDLPLLVNHFLNQFCQELNKEVYNVSAEALEVLQQYCWPGNVRELESVLKQSLLHATGAVLTANHLPEFVRTASQREATTSLDVFDTQGNLTRFVHERIDDGSEDLYAESLARMERALLALVLRHTDGNQLQAAKILGITRTRLRKKLQALDITIERVVETRAPN